MTTLHNFTKENCIYRLLYNCEDIGPNILVIRDYEDAVFGAFCMDDWHMALQFYGTGQSFLFKYH